MFRRGDSNTKANLSAASAHSGGSGGASAAAPAKQKFSISETGDENVFNDEAQVAEDLSPEDQQLVKALAEGAYHLPGYTFWQDWKQYFNNTHPLFGICFHHPLHPTGWGMRLLCFTASIVFGLVITNIVWLWSETQEDSVVFAVDVGDQVSQNSNLTQYLIDINSNNQVEVTKDMIILWTAGGAMHGFFDNIIWTLTACACCDPGEKWEHLRKYKRYGVGILTFAVLIITAVATLSVVLRASLANDEEVEFNKLKSAGFFDDAVDLGDQGKESYEFLLSYAVELAVALLFHFPAMGFILFSGVLGCGRISILGGRPYELRREEEELADLNGGVDPETGEPIKRTTEDMKSGLWKPSDKTGKISFMANFWNRKVNDKDEGNEGEAQETAPASKSVPNTGSSHQAARRMSTESHHSRNSNSTGVRQGSTGSSVNRRGSGPSPGSPTRSPRRVYNAPGAGASGYSGGRIYIPQQQGGRGAPPGVPSPPVYSGRSTQREVRSSPYEMQHGSRAPHSPMRSPRSPQRGPRPTTPGSPGNNSYPKNAATRMK